VLNRLLLQVHVPCTITSFRLRTYSQPVESEAASRKVVPGTEQRRDAVDNSRAAPNPGEITTRHRSGSIVGVGGSQLTRLVQRRAVVRNGTEESPKPVRDVARASDAVPLKRGTVVASSGRVVVSSAIVVEPK